jgi:hypothetical protein
MSRGTGSSVTINVAALKYSSFTVPVMEKEEPVSFTVYGKVPLEPIRRAVDSDSLNPDPDTDPDPDTYPDPASQVYPDPEF